MSVRSLKVNALLNFVKQLMTIVFPLVSFPYVSRVLGSSEFGKYNIASSLVSYFSLLALFGITNYAVREGARIRDNQEEISRFASQMFSINLITTTISYVILFLIVSLSQKFQPYSTLILIQSLCLMMNLIGQDWLNTVFEDFLYITLRYIVLQVFALGAIFAFVRTEHDTAIYCLIMVLASYGGNIINLFHLRKYVDVRFTWNVPFRKVALPLLILFINSLAVIIYVNSDITILGLFKDDSVVGVYSFASKLYNIIKQLINATILVFVPRLTVYYISDHNRYGKLISIIINLLVLLVIPMTVALSILSPKIIWVAGGNQYISGSTSFSILIFSIIFALISSVYTNCILIISRNEKKILVATSVSALVNVIGNIIFIPFIGMIGAALTTLVSELLNLAIQQYYAHQFITYKFFNRLVVLLAVVGGLIATVVSLVMTQFITTYSLISVVAMLATTMVLIVSLYGLVLFFFRARLRKIFR